MKPWLEEKGIFVPCSINCIIWNKPVTIDHLFLDGWDAVFLWNILKRTLKKELPGTAYGIRFLPTDITGGLLYDMVVFMCMHSLWNTGMAVRNADADVRPAREYFIDNAMYIREICRNQDEAQAWINALDDLVSLKRI